jgi:uncharacterized MAPEG superfamily protein
LDFLAASPIGGLPPEIAYLALASALLGVHIVLQSLLLIRDLGADYNASARDEQRSPGPLGSRAERALRNFLETFAVFAALSLAVTVTGKADWWSGLGAALYFWARVVYVPLYLGGVPYFRSLVWLVAAAGMLIIFWRLVW